jgi:hypothetical protein
MRLKVSLIVLITVKRTLWWIRDKAWSMVSFRSPFLFYLLVHSRCRGFRFSLDPTLTHATFVRTPLDEGSDLRRDLYLTTQTLYKRQISMPPVGFEPTIPASARPQTYALARPLGSARMKNTDQNFKFTLVEIPVVRSLWLNQIATWLSLEQKHNNLFHVLFITGL